MHHCRTHSFIPKSLEDLFDPSRAPPTIFNLTAHYIVRSPEPALGAPHILRLVSLHCSEPLLSLDMKVQITLVCYPPKLQFTEHGVEGSFLQEPSASGILGWVIGARHWCPGFIQFVVAGVQDGKLVVAMIDTPKDRIDLAKCPSFAYKFNGTWYGRFLETAIMYGRVTSIFPDLWADQDFPTMWDHELEDKSELKKFVPKFRNRLYRLKWTPTWHEANWANTTPDDQYASFVSSHSAFPSTSSTHSFFPHLGRPAV